MRVSRILVTVFSMFAMVAVVASEEPQMPQPTAEHEVLGMWVGTWSGEGEMKPGAFGPGGPMAWTEECSWFEGAKYHVVCTSEGDSPMGPMKGLGIVGYHTEKKVYTHFGIDNNGWTGYSEGTRSGEEWTFQSEELMGGKTYYSRFVMSWKSENTMAFTWEMSEDGESWTVMMEGKSTKQ